MAMGPTFREPYASVPLVLSRSLLDRVHEAAARHGMNRSAFIRRAVEQVLGAEDGGAPGEHPHDGDGPAASDKQSQ